MFIQVSSTTATKAQANKIAKLLIKNKLAACVQVIGPISSTFQWKSKITNSTEWLVQAKTEKRFYLEVEEIIIANHTYELPEIIVTPVLGGSKSYLKWLAGQLKA